MANGNEQKTHCPQGHEYTPKNTRLRRQAKNKNRFARVCRTCERAYSQHYEKTRQRHNNRTYRQRIRDKCFDHYGHVCACCGETNEVFLEFDHIENNGNELRRQLTGKPYGTSDLLKWLVRNDFPEDHKIQVLCANCHTAKTKLGSCPFHQDAW